MNRFGRIFRPVIWFLALLLSTVVAGCGGGGGGGSGSFGNPSGGVCAGADCVDLGATGGTFVILSQAAITSVPTSPITGNVGASPITGAAIGVTCADVTGTIYDTDGAYTGGGAADVSCRVTDATLLGTAVGDAGLAFADADSKTPGLGNTNLGAGDITGLDFGPGVYNWTTGVLNTGVVTVTGSATDVWVFQIAGDLTLGNGATVTLAGGALPKNIFWRTAGVASLGTTAHLEGIILSDSSITLATTASVNGRLYAGTAVTLNQNTIVRPAP